MDGGWSKWISFYPGFTQSSKNFVPIVANSKPDSNKTNPTIKNVLDFDYPEISDLKKTPVITPISANNIEKPKIAAMVPTTIQSQPHITNKPTSIPAGAPTVEKTMSNIVPPIIPNVNRSTKPPNVNKTIINNNSNSSRHSNDITPSTSSSSDDEEDRRIFEKNNITKPEIQETNDLSNNDIKQQPLPPSIPISTRENQKSLNNPLYQRVQQVNLFSLYFCLELK